MDETRLNRLRDELKKARKRRDEWDVKVKDLERRYKEAENTCISMTWCMRRTLRRNSWRS